MHFRNIILSFGWGTNEYRAKLEAEWPIQKLWESSRNKVIKVWTMLQTLELRKSSVWEIELKVGPSSGLFLGDGIRQEGGVKAENLGAE